MDDLKKATKAGVSEPAIASAKHGEGGLTPVLIGLGRLDVVEDEELLSLVVEELGPKNRVFAR